MGTTDVEGNTGRLPNRRLSIVPDDIPFWLQARPPGSQTGVCWADADPALLLAAVIAVTARGAGFSLSESRDHCAVSITVLSGQDRPKFYAANLTELNELLRRFAGRP